MSEAPGYRREGGSGLGIVLGAVASLSVLMGVLTYWRYAKSEEYVRVGILDMQKRGADLDAEQCVDATLAWAHDCDINGTNAVVCEQAIKIVLFHCLKAKDRADECVPYDKPRASGSWVYEVCVEKGFECPSKRECGCAEAYRGLESFCLNDQERMQL